jgi:hypothetical protein
VVVVSVVVVVAFFCTTQISVSLLYTSRPQQSRLHSRLNSRSSQQRNSFGLYS